MTRMRLLSCITAAVLAFSAATPAASAVIADFDGSFGSFSATRNGPFDDFWTFDVPEDGLASAGVIGVKVTFQPGLVFDLVSFNGNAMIDADPSDNVFEFAIEDLQVFAGTQTIEVKGSGHGSYGGSVAYEPNAVPEPTTWALMILGFGGVGAMLRRRQFAFA